MNKINPDKKIDSNTEIKQLGAFIRGQKRKVELDQKVQKIALPHIERYPKTQ